MGWVAALDVAAIDGTAAGTAAVDRIKNDNTDSVVKSFLVEMVMPRSPPSTPKFVLSQVETEMITGTMASHQRPSMTCKRWSTYASPQNELFHPIQLHKHSENNINKGVA